MDCNELRPAVGRYEGVIAGAALAGANDIDADGEPRRRTADSEENDNACLVRDIEEQRLGAVGLEKYGLGAFITDRRSCVPGHFAETGDGETLEEGRAEAEFGILDKVVA